MNYLESLSDNERYIISEIVTGWREKSYSLPDKDISLSDKLGIHLYELLNRLLQKNSIRTVDIAYQIDIDGGDICLSHFFETEYLKKNLGKNYNNQLRNIVTQQIQSLITGIGFISKLYQDGAIYFPSECFEDSKFEEWHVPYEDYPKQKYHWEHSYICSKKFAKFLDQFLQSAICPSFQLIELYKNDYKTIEARRYDEQQAINCKALKRAKRANIIAIIIAVVSMAISIICAVCIPVKISDKQHNELIEVLKTKHNGKVENAKP